jgi:hypothetical protein
MPKVKGTNVVGAVKLLRANRERALTLLPARLHHYLQERLLVSSWYPEEDQIELLRVIARLMPPTPNPFVVMGMTTAQADLTGIYRNSLRADDPQRTLLAAGGLWRNYHDTGEMSASDEGSKAAVVRLRGYQAACVEMCRVVEGYLIGCSRVAGASDVRTTKLTCSLDGAPECSWRLAWS